jgi:signal transduction histidine kinase
VISGGIDDARSFVGLADADLAALRRAAPVLKPVLAEMADRFYEALLAHPAAMRAFSGPDQLERLKGTLQTWAKEMICLPRDEAYAEKRARIGRVHVDLGIDQRYVLGAMGLVRDFLQARARAALGADGEAVAAAIGRACDLDLILITASYHDATRLKDRLAALAREAERGKMAALGTLAAGLAHEVGNPLASISAICQLIERKGAGEDAGRLAERVRTIREAIDRIDALVRRVLEFARAGPVGEEGLAAVEIAEAVRRVLDLVGLDERLKGIEIAVDVPSGLAVRAPRAGLDQVLMNLVLNAAEATMGQGPHVSGRRPGTGRVTIRAARADADVSIVVEDDGPGFTAEAVRRATEPFYTTKEGGTGLGLAISYGIVERAGGRLAVSNRPGGGGRVEVRFPGA